MRSRASGIFFWRYIVVTTSLFLSIPLTQTRSQAVEERADSLASQELLFYYGENFYRWLEFRDLDDQELRKLLYEILSGKHLSRENDFDEIVAECPEHLAEGESCTGHRPLDYAEARRYLFGELHLSEDGRSIRDVYGLHSFTQDDFGNQAGPKPHTIPHHEVLNTEHTWPQSRFNKSKGKDLMHFQKGDLHHLFPTANRLNSYRENHLFGETQGEFGISFITALGEFESTCRRGPPISFVGMESLARIPSVVFQPPEEHRGNLARALFYFSVRYELPIDPVEEHYLRRWHWQDPADDFEKSRNQRIAEIQNNRNPFIDFPELADEFEDF